MSPSITPLPLPQIAQLVRHGCVYIYALIDPDTLAVRYIGKSRRLVKRLQQHMNVSRNSRKHHVGHWLNRLIREQKRPLFALIETIGPERVSEWRERERYWIAHYRDLGYPLVNISPGGEEGPVGCKGGWLGRKQTPEHRAKVRAGRLGKPVIRKDPEAQQARRTAGVRAFHARLRAAGIKLVRGPHSEETKRRMSEAQKGRSKPLSPEHLASVRKAATRRMDKGRAVQQLNLDGSVVQDFPSVATAARALGISKTGINNCLKGRSKQSGGYRWRYVQPSTQPSIDSL